MSKTKDSFNVSKTSKFSVLDAPGVTSTSSASKQNKESTKSSTASKAVLPSISAATSTSKDNEPGVDIEQLILTHLSQHDDIADSWYFALQIKQDHQAVVGALKALLPDAYVKEELLTSTYFTLTQEGADILANGSPEYQVFKAITASTTVADIQSQLGETGKIGLGKCLQNKWVKKEGDVLVKLKDEVEDEVVSVLSLVQLSGGNLKEDDELKNLKKRKLVQQVTRKSYRITKGPAYQPVRVKRMAEITKDMLGNVAEV